MRKNVFKPAENLCQSEDTNPYKYFCKGHSNDIQNENPKVISILRHEIESELDQITSNILRSQIIYQYSQSDEIRKQVKEKNRTEINKVFRKLKDIEKELKSIIKNILKPADIIDYAKIKWASQKILDFSNKLYVIIGEHMARRYTEQILEKYEDKIKTTEDLKDDAIEDSKEENDLKEENKIMAKVEYKKEEKKRMINLEAVTLLAHDKNSLAKIETQTLSNIIQSQIDVKNMKKVVKKLKRFDKKYSPEINDTYKLDLSVDEKSQKLYQSMKTYRLPEIRWVCFSYITSLNRPHFKNMSFFFQNCMPNTIKEFGLRLKAVNKTEIDAAFSKVFPKITEKLAICEAEVNEKDVVMVLQAAHRIKWIELIECNIEGVNKEFDLQDKDYQLQQFYFYSTKEVLMNPLKLMFQGMANTSIKDTLQLISITITQNSDFESEAAFNELLRELGYEMAALNLKFV